MTALATWVTPQFVLTMAINTCSFKHTAQAMRVLGSNVRTSGDFVVGV